ncbi:division plane positioning ATPase MipZ [Parerythrobacter jejuensis]|uniref:AAA family ATPase n=1 Tax=Parerythrobacter jejuensis TaxID=795812 RepID=A0A845ATA7_9SPHN|nr:division plane positioning ATPase MipZ [Parerythrobacter jejuensis]MXP32071.1 AAA family ATPase [Parerythrobacter jejuensis]
MLNDNGHNGGFGSPPRALSPVSSDGEHPSVILADIKNRRKLPGKVVTFANEKGGVGKSTLAFHCAIALADMGQRVVAIDLDRRQRTLHRVLQYREGTATSLAVDLPMPSHSVLERPCAAQLWQEILRLDSKADFIVIDAAGADSPVFRRAIAMADTLVTPVNASFLDLELLGRHSPVTGAVSNSGCFASLVTDLREERARIGQGPIDWIVTKNRVRHAERRQIERVDEALEKLAIRHDFRIGRGLSERVAFRELFQFGLTHLDLKHLPGLARMQASTASEIEALIEDLALELRADPENRVHRRQPRTLASSSHAFSEALGALI